MTKKTPLVIVIDGIIGSGKTTLIEQCLVPGLAKAGYRVAVVPEPVDLWKQNGSLRQFYDDPKRRAYQFQTRAFHDRVRCSQKCHRAHEGTAEVFLLERSIFTDLLFMKMLKQSETVDESEYRDYLDLWTMWREVMPFRPNLFVYLRPALVTAMGRLKERNRDGEQKVSPEYQKLLQAEHDQYFAKKSVEIEPGVRVPCALLETDDNFRDEEGTKKKIVAFFVAEIKKARS